MLILLVFGAWGNYAPGKFNWAGFGGIGVTWILLALLGWKVFGAMIKG